MKTLLISSFHPFISRNILATELLSLLTQRGVRVVLLVPLLKQTFFEEEFGSLESQGVFIEAVPVISGWRDRFVNYCALSALRTRTLALKRKTEMQGRGEWLAPFLANVLGQRLVRALHTLLTPRGTFAQIFERYNPDLIFVTDVNHLFDMRLARDARTKDVPVLAMVRSWDNLTSKGLIRIIPDVLLVHSETERREALELQGVPGDRIEVIGIPHYDRYVTGVRLPREDFFARLGVSSRKRLVLFTPTGDRYLSNNNVDRDIVDLLDANLPDDCHLLVRLPPTDKVDALNNYSGRRVTIERPSTRFKTFKNIEIAPGDEEHLADSLFWSDLVITGPSTICVDAAFFDKPTILIGFDGKHARSYQEGIRRYYDYDHWVPVFQSGGVKLVETESQLVSALQDYLTDSTRDASGRAEIVRREAYQRDGKATERLANILSSSLSL